MTTTTNTAELAEVARRKGQRDARYTLYLWELCECCRPADVFCVVKVGIGLPTGDTRKGRGWTDKWECYVTVAEIEALQAEGWTAGPKPDAMEREHQPALF